MVKDFMFELTILSIFRQSEEYLTRYFNQVCEVFNDFPKPCHAIWLEGDSTDSTFDLLLKEKDKIEALGHTVTLIKFDLKGPYWPSIKNYQRWLQLATCWNKCLEQLKPSKFTICVESDLIWDPKVVKRIVSKIDRDHHVVCPMLMFAESVRYFRTKLFYDSWGFSREGRKFSSSPPYWKKAKGLKDEADLLQLTTGGGMIITTYETQKKGAWGLDSCIMKFPPEVLIFMDKTQEIYHPMPSKFKTCGKIKRMLMRYHMMIDIFLNNAFRNRGFHV